MSAKIGEVDEAIRYAKSVAPYADEASSGLSHNETRIVALACEVERLRKLVPENKR